MPERATVQVKKMRDKSTLLTVLGALLVLIMGVSALVRAETVVPAHVTVKRLQQEGWKVTAVDHRNERLPGLPPYEHLSRVVSISTYTLQRGDRTVTCEIAYDSQRDRLEEHCVDGDF